jgi:regulator of sirC expression with transglutaminase-like and TPR domain
MKHAGAIQVPDEPSESRRMALLSLLADEDPAIYRVARDQILACGPAATQWLRPHALSRDPTLRRRAQGIISHFHRQSADDRFLGFCLKHGQELDLEQGAWLLAQTRYPEINLEAYQALLDSYAADLRADVEPSGPAETVLTQINRYLFDKLRFTGNEADFYDPENSYLNRVLDRRTGNPINLCLVYLLLARRLRLPVTGIGLPGHFMCRYQSSAAEIYLDVFNRGKFLTKADCVRYLVQGNYGLREDYLAPVSPRRILLRICSNLHQIYLRQAFEEGTTRIQRYLVALAR